MSSDSEPEMFPYCPFTHHHVDPFVYQDPLRTPAITRAISDNDNERVKSLLNSGKCVNYADNNGNTPLHHAAYLNRTEVVRTLIEHEDIIIDCKNYEGYTPLLLHLSNNPVEEIVMILLSNGADVKTTSNLDESVLHMAVKHGNTNVVCALIKWGADINAQDYEMYTPLIEAVQCNHLELVCLLLYYDADVNIISSSGLTAFMYAIMSLRQYDVAKTLYDYYDDFSLVSIYGDTTLSLAAKVKNPIAIDIVKSFGIGYSCCTELLRISLTFDDIEFFKEIWKRIDFTNLTVHSDLTYAVLHTALSKNDWLDCMYLLLSSPVAQYLIGNITICAKGLFKRLFSTFQHKGIELTDRLRIMCLYLSLGYTTTLTDLSAIYEKHGFNEELHLLLDHPILECDKTEIIHPMVIFIFGFEKEISKQYLIYLLHKYASCTSIRDSTKNIAAILNTLNFFSVPYIDKQNFLICYSNSDTKISDVSEIPCLVELCRNKIRNHLRLICNIKKSHHIYNVVKRLPIPKTVLDILLFKKPLY